MSFMQHSLDFYIEICFSSPYKKGVVHIFTSSRFPKNGGFAGTAREEAREEGVNKQSKFLDSLGALTSSPVRVNMSPLF